MVAQISTSCAVRCSLAEMTCCLATVDGVCGEDTGYGLSVATNVTRHCNETTNVRVCGHITLHTACKYTAVTGDHRHPLATCVYLELQSMTCDAVTRTIISVMIWDQLISISNYKHACNIS